MAINETLKFSWGHIIAFVALIFIGYVSFMGLVYWGIPVSPAIGVLVISVLLLFFFIGAQLMKGTDVRFKKKIVYERILVFSAPFVFVVLMMPFTHFWSVFESQNEVESRFENAVKSTGGVFTGYEEHVESRMSNLNLERTDYHSDAKVNRLEALDVLLKGKDYEKLKEEANDWLKNYQHSSVWNASVIGNIDVLKNAFKSWNIHLKNISERRLLCEGVWVDSFTKHHQSVMSANRQLDALSDLFRRDSYFALPTFTAVLLMLVLYFALMLPYLIQRRNTKSYYRLFGMEGDNAKGDSDAFTFGEVDTKRAATRKDENPEEKNAPKSKYEGFTLD